MRRLELHHIAKECNSELTITLCVGNHLSISNHQMVWDSRSDLENNSENLRASFILQGIQELLIEKHIITGIQDYRFLADSLSSLIKSYRDRV